MSNDGVNWYDVSPGVVERLAQYIYDEVKFIGGSEHEQEELVKDMERVIRKFLMEEKL